MVLERPVDESTNLTTTHAVRTNCCLSGVTMSWSNTKEEQTPLKGEKFSLNHLLFGNVDFETFAIFQEHHPDFDRILTPHPDSSLIFI